MNTGMKKSNSLLTLEDVDSDPSIAFYIKGRYDSDNIEYYIARIEEAKNMFERMCERYNKNALGWTRKPIPQNSLLNAYENYIPETLEEYSILLKNLHKMFYKAEQYYKDFERDYYDEIRNKLSS
jgi:hypothetical protein